MFIPSEYIKFVKKKYVTCRRWRGRPHEVYILLIRVTSWVDIVMSVCLSV